MALTVNLNSKSLYTVSDLKPFKLLDSSYITSFVYDKFVSNFLDKFTSSNGKMKYVMYGEDDAFFDKKYQSTIASIYSIHNKYKSYCTPTSLYDINIHDGKGYDSTDRLLTHISREILFSSDGEIVSTNDDKKDYNYNAIAAYNDSRDRLYTFKKSILRKYYSFFENNFAKKNIRAYTKKELNTYEQYSNWANPGDIVGCDILEAGPFYIVVNAEKTVTGIDSFENPNAWSTPIPLQLVAVVRNFLVPLDVFAVSDYIWMYRYPEWLLNYKELIQSIDRVLISNKADYIAGAYKKTYQGFLPNNHPFVKNGYGRNSYHIYIGSDKFGYSPISYFEDSILGVDALYGNSMPGLFTLNVGLINHTDKFKTLNYTN